MGKFKFEIVGDIIEFNELANFCGEENFRIHNFAEFIIDDLNSHYSIKKPTFKKDESAELVPWVKASRLTKSSTTINDQLKAASINGDILKVVLVNYFIALDKKSTVEMSNLNRLLDRIQIPEHLKDDTLGIHKEMRDLNKFLINFFQESKFEDFGYRFNTNLRLVKCQTELNELVTVEKTNQIDLQSKDIVRKDEIHFDTKIFQCVSFIERFNPKVPKEIETGNDYFPKRRSFLFRMPLSLIKKLFPKEWLDTKDSFHTKDNLIGLSIVPDRKYGLFLRLNANGLAKSETLDEPIDEELVKNILISCDARIPAEIKLFNELIVKKRYFDLLFKNMSYSIELMLDEEKFPSNQKRVLFHRLLGNYYGEKEDDSAIKLMRHHYDTCINLLKEDSQNVLTSFFIEYADKEYQLGNKTKVYELLEYVVRNIERRNSTIRFFLAALYQGDEEGNIALGLLLNKVVDDDVHIEFYKTKGFLKKLTAQLDYFLDLGQSQDASNLQSIARRLAVYLTKNNENRIGQRILNSIQKKYGNNRLKKEFVKTLIRNDIEKAKQEIRRLELPSLRFHIVDLTELKIDLQLRLENISSAKKAALGFVKEHYNNQHIRLTNIHLKLGEIYSRENKYVLAKKWFEKIEYDWLNSIPNYLIALLKTNDKMALTKVKAHFNKNPLSQDQRLISQYISFCIKNDKLNLARLFIVEKSGNSKAHDYYKGFIAFLLQQQLRLTTNEAHVQSIIKNALALSSQKQKTNVYFNYGMHLLKIDAEEQNSNQKDSDAIYQSSYQISLALDQFKKVNSILESNDFEINLKASFYIAFCYYLLKRHKKSLAVLDKIDGNYQKDNVLLFKIKNLLKLKVKDDLTDFQKIEDSKLRKKAAFLIAESKLLSEKETKRLFAYSIGNTKSTHRRVQYAIYLESLGESYQSRIVLTNNGSITDLPAKARDRYLSGISRHIAPTDKNIINELGEQVKKKLENNQLNRKLLYRIDSTIKKNQYDSRLYVIKFDYLFRSKNYDECETLLDWLIKINHLDFRIANLFYRLADNYYRYTFNNFEINNGKRQVEKLAKALEFIEYALYFKESYFVFNRLYCCILYKLGDNKRFQSAFNSCLSVLTEKQKSELTIAVEIAKQRVDYFLWEEFISDYDTKREFFKVQERTAAILLIHKNVPDIISVKIYKSILLDKAFHTQNEHVIENNIKRRLGAYHYSRKNYQKALDYKSAIYKQIEFDGKFVGGLMASITNLGLFELGIEKAKYLISVNPTSYLYLKLGDFYKELESFDLAKETFDKGIEQFTEPLSRIRLHKGILWLYWRSIEINKPFFKTKQNMENEVQKVINTIRTLDEFYDGMQEIDDLLEQIRKWTRSKDDY